MLFWYHTFFKFLKLSNSETLSYRSSLFVKKPWEFPTMLAKCVKLEICRNFRGFQRAQYIRWKGAAVIPPPR